MYSFDLITRVLNAYNNRSSLKLSISDIIFFFDISNSTLYNWIDGKYFVSNGKRVFNKSNNISVHNYVKYILKYVRFNPQFMLKQLLCNIKDIFNVNISKQTIYNVLKRHNITNKKIQTNKYPHSQEKFKANVDELKKYIKPRKERIISIDETSIQLNTIRNNGWSSKGSRCIINNPNKYRLKTFSLLLAISKKTN